MGYPYIQSSPWRNNNNCVAAAAVVEGSCLCSGRPADFNFRIPGLKQPKWWLRQVRLVPFYWLLLSLNNEHIMKRQALSVMIHVWKLTTGDFSASSKSDTRTKKFSNLYLSSMGRRLSMYMSDSIQSLMLAWERLIVTWWILDPGVVVWWSNLSWKRQLNVIKWVLHTPPHKCNLDMASSPDLAVAVAHLTATRYTASG